MVKVVINNKRGLVQSSGQGTTVSDGIATQSGLDIRSNNRLTTGSAGQEVVTRSLFGLDTAPGSNTADPLSTSTTKLFPLGTKLQNGNRTFRYARAANAGIAIGETVQAPAPVANNNDRAVAQIDGSNPAVGDSALAVTLGGAPALNFFEEGYVAIVDGTGQGQLLHIASNDASASPCTLTLLEEVVVALDAADSKASVFPNQYAGLIKTPAAPSSAVLGVAPVAVSANEYFWLQPSGPAAVVQAGADQPAAGKIAVASDGTAGAAEILDIATIAESLALGHCISSTTTAADHCVILLNLE